MDVTGLPGGDLIERGLADLTAGRESDAAWLVLIGAPRLRRLGLTVPPAPAGWWTDGLDHSPEHKLYARLAAADSDTAHSRYNALIRTLVSFERAGECVS